MVQIVTGIELPCEVEIGQNFVIDHFGGIVISGYAKFGDNCRVQKRVVVGLQRVDQPCAPVIGDNVVIGANAVVIRDVPHDCIGASVPALNKPRRN
jgi:serine O-acetyltransferase